MVEKPVMVKVERAEQDSSQHKSIYFKFEKAEAAVPGQFLMVWVPGVDEKPISISKISKGEIGLTIQCKGKWSRVMCGVEKGSKIWVRGPYGNGFNLDVIKSAVIVAGGCGSAPLKSVVDNCLERGIETKVVLGAQNSGSLLFKNYLKEKLGDNLYITTDDGSEGKKGFTTDALKEIFKEGKPDRVFSCGPEPMMQAVLKLCEKENVDSELSLERFMRCGFGVCGQCVMEDLMVCKDGPVFKGEVLSKSKEFGNLARLKSGREVSLKEYADWRQE